MKILAINNYSIDKCLEAYRNGEMPAHHCWGVDYFKGKGDLVDTRLYLNMGGEYLGSYMMSGSISDCY